ncbi:MAG: DUF6456 domain-containing protein, partial [Sphingobium sp.]
MSNLVERARALLDRPGAWVEGEAGVYGLRLGPDRRARVNLVLDEAGLAALIASPGLRVRRGGGWASSRSRVLPDGPPAGRPGLIEGDRTVMDEGGRPRLKRANLGESPIAWLARRCDQSGRPWLTPVEVA